MTVLSPLRERALRSPRPSSSSFDSVEQLMRSDAVRSSRRRSRGHNAARLPALRSENPELEIALSSHNRVGLLKPPAAEPKKRILRFAPPSPGLNSLLSSSFVLLYSFSPIVSPALFVSFRLRSPVYCLPPSSLSSFSFLLSSLLLPRRLPSIPPPASGALAPYWLSS